MDVHDDEEGRNTRGVEMPSAASWMIGEKATRCGECDGCRADECGVCIMCKDMPKRGGKGLKRQPCERRVCQVVRQASEQRRIEREGQMEKLRAQREADRLARQERAEEEKRQKVEQREVARAAKAAEKAERQAAKAAAAALRKPARSGGAHSKAANKPPEYPKTLPPYGWGVGSASFGAGMLVEVLGVEEGLQGACFPGRLVTPNDRELADKPLSTELPRRPMMLLEPKLLPTAVPIAGAPAASAGGGRCNVDGNAVGVGDGDGGSAPGGGGDAPSGSARAPDAEPGVDARWLLVEYDELYEDDADDAAHLREWMSSDLIRERPPGCPPGFLSLVRPGDMLQFLLDDSWWDVSLESIDGNVALCNNAGLDDAAPFVVASVLYAATHRARASELRPMWMMDDCDAWRYEILAGSGRCAVRRRPAAAASSDADGQAYQASGDEERPESQALFAFAEHLPRQHTALFQANQAAEAARAASAQ